jgi:tRNA1Val (adenine37-N6)-methyltransferase
VTGVTHDALLRGRLLLKQPREGYRTNVDALLLAHFAKAKKQADFALDLGSGVGAVGLALMHLDAVAQVTFADMDAAALAFAAENAAHNGFASRASVLEVDVRSRWPTAHAHRFDLVVCNPPYAIAGATRPPKIPSVARARVGDDDTLEGFARATRQALGAASRACFVYPTRELDRLFRSLRRAGLEPKRMRLVHGTPRAEARVALVECKPARAGGLIVEAPLVETDGEGRSTPELTTIVDGGSAR